ncbi:FG-GAP-like repeat-containing protein [Calothrix sp. UHCC 0171]|uniref:FG-GAP-like repeat-containing protein n=1 Tax=Calothrix sp. UHCC 0171 TaxID=3110245 RepID=UPI002B203BD6|nr:FG-GAP-like repeat-containing protein [Calothrix sp. UHCC 0171]MEA5570640.1 FG-GAP-like repeat-containing protein [Calothrix sp. UHCC 0171]
MNNLSKTNQELNTKINSNFAINLTSPPLNTNLLLSTSSSSLVFIDTGIADYQSLVKGISQGSEVHILNSDQDAIAQITETLMGREGISSLHIISHGDTGGLQLGNDWLNVSNLNNYANQMQSWKTALAQDADILLYGCNVGAGTTGKAFVNLMSQLTGADVAASNNLTGNIVLGGDWDLEVKTGSIESVIALTTETIQTYSSTLNSSTLNLSFAAPINFTAGEAPWALSIGDINGDGEQDLAVANYISNNVSVLLGNGDGTFANPINFTAGDGPSGVSIGDINGDRQPDLVVTNFNGNNVSLLLGNGDGTFAAPTNFTVASGSMDTARVTIGDINSDGKQDLAIVNYISSKILVLLGNGDGTFAAPTELTAENAPAAVSIGDINGDGKQDLAVAKYGYYGDTSVPNSNHISVLLGHGDGTFAAPINFTAGDGPEGISIGDINGDGKQDLAVANYKSNNISVLLGNGDGKQDLVVTNYDANTISVLLNNQPQIQRRKHDFDGDGKADILWRNQTTGENAIWTVDNFQLRDAEFITPVPDVNWKIVTTGDFNGDGKADILWRNYSSGENAIWMMDGLQPLSAESRQFITRVEDIHWKIIAAADFNGDGKSDILWRNSKTGENAVWFMNDFQLDGQFLEYRTIDTDWVMVDAGDFDADGKSDILWRNSKTGENAIWLMNGSRLKDAKFLVKTDLNWKIEKVGDLNGDRKDDIVWRNYYTGEMAVWFVDVNQLDSFNNYSVHGEFIAIEKSNKVFLKDTDWKLEAIADYNGDNKYDLIWRNYSNGKTAIWWMDSHQIVDSGYIIQSTAMLNVKADWEITL